ncbi:glycosyltransferase, partial [Mycobacterium sp. ITM-2017-0098]
GHDAVLGMAHDGGWWVLGVRDAAAAGCLRDVPMSAPDTGKLTREALQYNDLRVVLTEELGDVDTVGDIGAVRNACPPMSRFRRIT